MEADRKERHGTGRLLRGASRWAGPSSRGSGPRTEERGVEIHARRGGGQRGRSGCLPCLLRSPIATSTPTMPYPLPHPGLEHEGDERINKVSFVVAFCVDTSTKQSKLHSPRERTFVLPPSPPSRQFSSQGPSIPPSTSSSTTLLTLPQTPMPTPTLHRHSPPGNAVSTGSSYTKSGKAQSRIKRLV